MTPLRRLAWTSLLAVSVIAPTEVRAEQEREDNGTFDTANFLEWGETTVVAELEPIWENPDFSFDSVLEPGEVESYEIPPPAAPALAPGEPYLVYTRPDASPGMPPTLLRVDLDNGSWLWTWMSGPFWQEGGAGGALRTEPSGRIQVSVSAEPDFGFTGEHDATRSYELAVVVDSPDVDYFVFTGFKPGQPFVAQTVDYQFTGIDTMLVHLDQWGEIIASNNDREEGVWTSQLSGTVPEDGEIYFMVTGGSDWNVDGLHTDSGPYSLQVTAAEEVPAQTPEPDPVCGEGASFQVLPPLVGGSDPRLYKAFPLSTDAEIYFGRSRDSAGVQRNVFWRRSELFSLAHLLDEPTGFAPERAWLGTKVIEGTVSGDPALWNRGTGDLTVLPELPLPGGTPSATLRAVSANGEWKVGTSRGPVTLKGCWSADWENRLVRWTPSGAIEDLGQLPRMLGASGTEPHVTRNNVPIAISNDGTTILGYASESRRSRAGSQCSPRETLTVPYLWHDGAFQILEALPFDRTACDSGPEVLAKTTFVDASADLTAAIGLSATHCGSSSGDPVSKEFYWTLQGGMQELPLDNVTGISPSGKLVYGGLNSTFGVMVWDPIRGTRPLEDVLDELGVSFNENLLRSGNNIGEGLSDTVLAGHYLLAPWVAVLPCSDLDKDALCDSWETAGGVDLNGDGEITKPCTEASCPDLVLDGADPMKMDIFVEVDRLAGSVFTPKVLTDVEKAFADVPAALIANGQSAAGVNLHLDLDEEDLSLISGGTLWASRTPVDPGGECDLGRYPDLQAFRETRFGTPGERTNPEVIALKRRIVRHLIFGGALPNERDPTKLGPGGIAEYSGNEAIVAKDWTYGGSPPPDALATTVMHELGHTLGLKHGGGDHRQYKPNYYSIMNYTWAAPMNVTLGTLRAKQALLKSWKLDYSRRAFDPLEESFLSELIGLRGIPNKVTAAGPLGTCPGGAQGCARTVSLWDEIDWDQDRGFDLVPVGPVDVNKVIDPSRDGNSGFGANLVGFNDWTYVTGHLCHSYSHPTWGDSPGAASCEDLQGPAEHLANRTADEVDAFLEQDFFIDCNLNGADDSDDILAGVDVDSNDDGILDGCEPLWGDIDEDGDLDEDDRQLLISSFGRTDGEPEYLPLSDLDDDRFITHADYHQWVERLETWESSGASSPATVGTTACGLLGIEPLLFWLLSYRLRRAARGRSRPASSASGAS